MIETVYFEIAPWGVGRYRKRNVPPMQCIYIKDIPRAETPSGWTDEEKTHAFKLHALSQAQKRAKI